MDSPPLRKFQVRLNGENFLLAREGAPPSVFGFYTTRWVEAKDPEEAELAAIELIRNDPTLVGTVRNARDDSPIINVESVYELSDFDGVNPPGGGYTFYHVESDS